jgi:CRP/FNR family transcriptional regulator, cyclic AMP receptor protein
MINPFKKTFTTEELTLFRFLSSVKLFESLSYNEMQQFLPYLYLRTYKADEAVFFRNDPSHALYLIKNGKVTLNIDIYDRFEELTVLQTSDHFGDNSLLDQTNRIYNAIVISESAEIYVIPQVNILSIFSQNVEIKAKMLEALATLYNSYTNNLFKAYKSSFGFFNLGQAYIKGEGL